MLNNLFPFILVFFLCVVLFFVHDNCTKDRDKRFIEILTLICLALFAGLRYDVGGSDYFIYQDIFDRCPDLYDFINDFYNLEKYFFIKYEKGYLFCNSLFKTIGFSFHGFILVHSFFFFICFYWGLRKYTNCLMLVIIVFLYKMYFWDVFVLLRQTIAVGIFFCTMHCIEQKKFVKYLAGIYLATLFHSSAFILFPLYFINRFNLSRRRVVILNAIFLPTILFSIYDVNVLGPFSSLLENSMGYESFYGSRVERIITGEYGGENRVSFLNLLEYFFITIVVLFNFEKIIKRNNYSHFFLKLFICLLPFFTLFSGNELFVRFREFFILSYAFIFIYLAKSSPRYKWTIYTLVIIISFIGYLRFLIIFDNGVIYNSILFKSISLFR